LTEAAISDFDLHLFGEGNHQRIYDKLGAHPHSSGAARGTRFAVWAPNAERVSVVGAFNQWDGNAHVMRHAVAFGGSGYSRQSEVEASPASAFGQSLRLNMPPLGAVFFVGP
jgi:1,4-alpha-glucan branching enzyme